MADADPMEKIRDDTHVTPDPAGLLGSGCAGTALRVMKIAYKFCVPMSSNSTTDPGWSDRGDYPHFSVPSLWTHFTMGPGLLTVR